MSKVPDNIQKKAEKLKKEIEHHNRKYYSDTSSEISDFEFDKLMHSLIDLEKKHPDLKTKDSPTQRVGGEPSRGFKTITHKVPMLSLDNTYSADDLREFDKRVAKVTQDYTYAAELKIDGAAVTVKYIDGYLVSGATRGDGENGDDATENIKTIGSIPLKIDIMGEMEVRGEIYRSKEQCKKINVLKEEDIDKWAL